MISFSKDKVFNLKKISNREINSNAEKLLLQNEGIIVVYKIIIS